MTKLALIAVFIAFALPAAAQVSEPNAESAYPSPKKGDQPDIPGAFVLELGINSAIDAPERFDLGFWGSRTFNIYYQYEIRILQSNFSFVPGFGLSLERFKFRNGATLAYDEDDSLKLILPPEGTIPGLRKSQLVTNYFEVPVEFRFNTNPSDLGRSFKIAVGGRVGYMYDSFSKLKYEEDGENKQLKDKQNWNLTRFRYGVYGKLGIGNFGVFGYYNITPLFEEGKGPGENNVVKDFNTFTLGVSLSAF